MITTTSLEFARSLDRPDRNAVLRRDPSVASFWREHRRHLVDAWAEWDSAHEVVLDDSVLDPALRAAIADAWADPTSEANVRHLLHEAAPGVFSFQFFDPDRIASLRSYLDDVWDAGIPLRAPYGIVLNRRGAMLDPRSDGYLAAPTFQSFYRSVLDSYARPIARLLFPEIVGYDTQTFGFSIHYRPDTDTSIRPHTDASSVTFNINVNLPDEAFTGSTVDFFDAATGEVNVLSFEPGTAMIHRGSVPHTAQPITSGERTNLVLWLVGQNGSMPREESTGPAASPAERWTTPTAPQGAWAPF